MNRRHGALATVLVLLLVHVGLAQPAAAAGFAGSATTSGDTRVAGGGAFTVTVDVSGLSPAPASVTLSYQRQAVGGGAITPFGTDETIPLAGEPSVSRSVPTQPADGGSYVFVRADVAGPGGETYVVHHQVEVTVPLLVPDAATVPVSGTARIGSTLVADVDPAWWTPAADAVAVEWRDVGTNAVLGTGSSYPLTSDDLGRTVYAQATATRTSYAPSTVTSTFVGAVGLGELVLVSAPRIDDGLRVGRTTTVVAPVLTPTPDTVDYQWHLADGTPVAGATAASITPTADLLGESLYVVATARRADHQDHQVASNLSGAVALDAFDLVSAPTLPASAVVGQTLTVTAPVLDPAPDHVTYQWYRTPDIALPGATGTTYTPTTDDLGAQLYVVATAQRALTQDHVVASTMTGAVAPRPFVTAPVPTITGTAFVGTVLTADAHVDAWAPTPTSVTYRWYRADASDPAGEPVAGATGATLAVTAADAGAWFFVEVTAHAPGAADHVVGSAPSRTVQAPWAAPSDGDDDATVVVTAGGRLRAELHALAPGVEHVLELHSDPVVLGTVVPAADGTASVDVVVPASVPAGSHTLVVLRDGDVVVELPVTVVTDAAGPGPGPAPTSTAAPAAGTGTLARTGTDPAAAGAVALTLVVLGAAVLGTARRRTRTAGR